MNKNQSLLWDHPRFRSWVAVGRACQLMQSSLTRALAPLDIKPPHLDILVNLYRREGLSQQELARKLLVGRSNMSMLLPQLEARGLIERIGDKTDKRVLRLFLTEDGKALTEKAMVVQLDLIERTLSVVDVDKCLEMAGHMEAIVSILMAQESDAEDERTIS